MWFFFKAWTLVLPKSPEIQGVKQPTLPLTPAPPASCCPMLSSSAGKNVPKQGREKSHRTLLQFETGKLTPNANSSLLGGSSALFSQHLHLSIHSAGEETRQGDHFYFRGEEPGS